MSDSLLKSCFCAPISGRIVPPSHLLADDFSLKMKRLGFSGITIESTSCDLVAPVGGTVIQCYGNHALTLRSSQYVDIFLHIQSDVPNSESTLCVKDGESITAGQKLIRLDPAVLARSPAPLVQLFILRQATSLPTYLTDGNVIAGETTVVTIDKSPSTIRDIFAPLSGSLVPLEDVPDPVFAQKMVGDGISIDPTSDELLAPVEGIITNLHRAHHALTITTPEGIEVLLHIGIDTVALKGEGFFPLVNEGETVCVGQPLIRFAPDFIAKRAPSLLTQILIANPERVNFLERRSGTAKAGQDLILTLDLLAMPEKANAGAVGVVNTTEIAGPVSLPNPLGLHARPAAVLAARAKQFLSDIRLVCGQKEANAKSVIAIMGMATQKDDRILIKAYGSDAKAAAASLAQLLAEGCGEKAEDAMYAEPVKAAVATRCISTNPDELVGVPAAPGIAIGRIHRVHQEFIEIAEEGGLPQQEEKYLNVALRESQAAIELLKGQIPDPAKAEILAAHIELLNDPDLLNLAVEGIHAGKSAAFAWRKAFTCYAAQLEMLENALLRERANDIRDIGRRVLAFLAGVTLSKIDVPAGSILVAEEFSPSEMTELNPAWVIGLCSTMGGATSHVAILARSLGIPFVCAIDVGILTITDGTQVILDGGRGVLHSKPSDADLNNAKEGITRQQARQEAEQAKAHLPGKTADGQRIEVLVNVANTKDAQDGFAKGAEGVGLLRSEFLFDKRDTPPTEEEQAAAYIAVAEAFNAKHPLIIRTLDVGGDKPLSYLPLPKEENPFLGMRGVRVSLDRPDIFRTQLRAILRAAPLCQLHIMFPMIARLEELREAKAILAEEQLRLNTAPIKIGIMIEVPSAALMAEQFAREVDFFSIGTNDLTQYTLAMDRGHPKLGRQADALHPSILKMIAMTCDGAKKHGKPVGVCGGMASEPLAVPVLIGLGVTELSVSVPVVASIKATLARISLRDCQQLAQEALLSQTAAEVRALLSRFAPQE